MKTINLILCLLFLSIIANAQPAKRVSAFNYLKYGELDQAKANIDEAIEHARTKTDPRTWWYRGLIYQSIHTSDNPNYKKLSSNASEIAFESYKNALLYNFTNPELQKLKLDDQIDVIKFFTALNDKSTRYVDQELLIDILMNQFPPLSNIFVNRGVEAYQDEQNYKKAYELFSKSLFVSGMSMRIDTPVIYYSAIAAEKAGLHDEAKASFETLIRLDYGTNEVEKASNYYFLGNIFKAKGDTVKFLETYKKGIDKYPGNNSILVVELINFYLSNNQSQEALNYLELALQADPNNATYYFAKGSLYDNHYKDVVKAGEAYKKAIELDPNYFDANYNMGAIYFNEGVEIINKANDEKDMKKYQKMKAESDEKLKASLPFLEKAHEVNANDLPTMESLRNIYYRLGQIEKSEEMKKKIDAL